MKSASLRASPASGLLLLGALAFAACSDDTSGGGGSASTVQVDVTGVFAAGQALRDAYSDTPYVVAEDGSVTVDAGEAGVVLLERDEAPGSEASFSWDNATVYFVATDRFENGDPSNDDAYGRQPAEGETLGTFHGGDFAGLIARMDYLDDLGVNALWITPPVEQIHGWVGGGTGDFQHYAYMGYWALDFTKLDANLGTEDELRDLVAAAHARGIRVIFDVVMNHPGYYSLEEMTTYAPSVLLDGHERWLDPIAPLEGAETWQTWNGRVGYQSRAGWEDLWGPTWIRAGLVGHTPGGTDDLTMSLASLPDFKTETSTVPGLPPILQAKTDTRATENDGATNRDNHVARHADWVRRFGVDGFRADTAKHVELEAWTELKTAALAALDDWKTNNPDDALDEEAFWMTGEVFPRNAGETPEYFQAGFDSMINFQFQTEARSVIKDLSIIEERYYSAYAELINQNANQNELTYISSHDTSLFWNGSVDDQKLVGTILMMMPGGIQIFYGDESARPNGPPSSDETNKTRSDMNWDDIEAGGEKASIVEHWQKVGQFRNRHQAVGAGAHEQLSSSDNGYAFARTLQTDEFDDRVVVVIVEEADTPQ